MELQKIDIFRFFLQIHRGQPGSKDILKYYFLYFSIKHNKLLINLHRWTSASNFSKNCVKWVSLLWAVPQKQPLPLQISGYKHGRNDIENTST